MRFSPHGLYITALVIILSCVAHIAPAHAQMPDWLFSPGGSNGGQQEPVQSSSTSLSIDTAMQAIAVLGGSGESVQSGDCSIDARGMTPGARIEVDSNGCDEVVIAVSNDIDVSISSAQSTVRTSGQFRSLSLNIGNSSAVIDASVVGITSVTAANSPVDIRLLGSELMLDVANEPVTMTNVQVARIGGKVSNDRVSIVDSVLPFGQLILINAPLMLENVVFGANLELINSKVTGGQVALEEGTSRSIKSKNSSVNFRGLRCVPQGANAFTPALATSMKTTFKRKTPTRFRATTVLSRKQQGRAGKRCAAISLNVLNAKYRAR